MLVQSIRRQELDKPEKPDKPRRDFPLTPHASGKWCKTINGKTRYFGKWSDPDGAENEYLIFIGKRPRYAIAEGGLTVRQLCNSFMTAKRQKFDSGDIGARALMDYDATCRQLIECFGVECPVANLKPNDFSELYSFLAKDISLRTLKKHIVQVRSIFKRAYEAGDIDQPMRFGPDFKPPSASKLRIADDKKEQEHGSRTLKAAEVRALLEAASPQMRAMILVGLNCAFGNSDIGSLPLSAVDLKGGWITFPRPKTGIKRRCPLWPETVAALKAVLADRPKPATPDNANCVFLMPSGQRWVQFEIVQRDGKADSGDNKKFFAHRDDPLGKAFGKLLRELGFKRKGMSFYSLRHTFRTQADGTKDFPVVRVIMGHADNSVEGGYNHLSAIDDRLRAVVDHVHAWLFAESAQ